MQVSTQATQRRGALSWTVPPHAGLCPACPSQQGSAFSEGGRGEGPCYPESRSTTVPPTVGAASLEDLEEESAVFTPHGSLRSLRLMPNDTYLEHRTGPTFLTLALSAPPM